MLRGTYFAVFLAHGPRPTVLVPASKPVEHAPTMNVSLEPVSDVPALLPVDVLAQTVLLAATEHALVPVSGRGVVVRAFTSSFAIHPLAGINVARRRHAEHTVTCALTELPLAQVLVAIRQNKPADAVELTSLPMPSVHAVVREIATATSMTTVVLPLAFVFLPFRRHQDARALYHTANRMPHKLVAVQLRKLGLAVVHTTNPLPSVPIIAIPNHSSEPEPAPATPTTTATQPHRDSHSHTATARFRVRVTVGAGERALAMAVPITKFALVHLTGWMPVTTPRGQQWPLPLIPVPELPARTKTGPAHDACHFATRRSTAGHLHRRRCQHHGGRHLSTGRCTWNHLGTSSFPYRWECPLAAMARRQPMGST